MYVPSGRRNNSRGTVMSGSAIRGRQGSERFFTLPAVTLIASSFVLGMSDFVVVGILPDIAHGLRVLEVTVGNLVSRFATHLTLRRVPRRQHPVCARAELRGAAALQPHGEGRFSAAVPHAGRQWPSQCLASPNHPR